MIVRAIWQYRGFVLGMVKRELQQRYLSSLLGSAWAFLNPAAMITIYTVVFSQVMRSRLAGSDAPFAYSIFLCAGVLTWGLFAEITTRGRDAVAVATRDLMAADFGLAGYSEPDREALFTLLRGLRLSAGDFTDS